MFWARGWREVTWQSTWTPCPLCDLKGRVHPDFRFESSILRLGEILSVFIEPKLASRDCLDAVLGISFPFLPAVRCLQHRPPPPPQLRGRVRCSDRVGPRQTTEGPKWRFKNRLARSCKVTCYLGDPCKTNKNIFWLLLPYMVNWIIWKHELADTRELPQGRLTGRLPPGRTHRSRKGDLCWAPLLWRGGLFTTRRIWQPERHWTASWEWGDRS